MGDGVPVAVGRIKILRFGSPGRVVLSPATITSTPFDMTRVAKLCLASSASKALAIAAVPLVPV